MSNGWALRKKVGVREIGCRSPRWDTVRARGQVCPNRRRFTQLENGDCDTRKLTKPAAQNTSPKDAWSTKQTWKYCMKREAELFRSLGLPRWPTVSIFCNPFPTKEGKDLIQQTGSLLGAAQQCSLCLIPKISLEIATGNCNWSRIGAGASEQHGSSGDVGIHGFGGSSRRCKFPCCSP